MIKLTFNQNDFIIPQELDCINELRELIIINNLYLCDCCSTDYYWKSDKQVFECKFCKKRKSVKSFCNIMQNSNLKINLWLSILHLHCIDCNPTKIQRILNHKKYSTIWDKVFLIEQTEKKYHINRQNSQNDPNTNIKTISNFSISEQISFTQALSSNKHIECNLYWNWFLQI